MAGQLRELINRRGKFKNYEKSTGEKMKMSFGKKLMLAFAVMFVATLALSIASLTGLSGVIGEFDTTATKTAKKMQIAGSIGIDASEVLSLERGVVLRLSIKDMAKAEAYHHKLEETLQLLASEIAEIRPLLTVERSRRDVDTVEAVSKAWLPASEELWRAGQ